MVDDDMFEEISKYSWQAHKCNHTVYAERTYFENGEKKCTSMHRQILELGDSKLKGDHIDHNGLNNQRSNLRVATFRQNNMNRTSLNGSASKYLGVHLHINRKTGYTRWTAQIRIGGKQTCLGYFKDEEYAAKKYDEFAKIHHKEFANLNFPAKAA